MKTLGEWVAGIGEISCTRRERPSIRYQFSRWTVGVCVLLLFTLLTAPAIRAASTQTIELKIGHGQPTVHFIHRVLTAWANKVEEKTNGKVHFKIYPVGTLSPPAEIYEALSKGMMDVGCAPEGYTAARFPLNLGSTLAMFGIPSAEVGSRIRMDLLKAFPEMREEYKDTHVLWLSTHPAANLHSISPIRTVQDLRNVQVRTPPGLPPWITALGAVPVVMPMPQTYEAVQKGIVQAFVGTNEILKTFRLAEVSKYTTVLKFYSGGFFVAMNPKSWQRLPPDVQEVITGLNDWARIEFAKAYDEDDAEGTEFAKRAGHEFIYPSRETLDEVKNLIISKAHSSWAADMESKGKPGKAILAELYRLIEKYSN